MPIKVERDGVEYNLVPAPLVSFSKSIVNNVGRPGFSTEYSIGLQGTIVPTHGNPMATGGFSDSSWTTTIGVEDEEVVSLGGSEFLDATMTKQEHIRWLFSPQVGKIGNSGNIEKPIKLSITGWEASNSMLGTGIICHAFVDEVSFDSDGNWVNPNAYTISLRAFNFDGGELFGNGTEGQGSGYFVSSLTESVDISEDSQRVINYQIHDPSASHLEKFYKHEDNRKVYSINRTISAVGQPVYGSDGSYRDGLAPWQQASGAVYSYISDPKNALDRTKNLSPSHQFGSGWYFGNSVLSESINQEDGTYNISESVLAYSHSGTHYDAIETVSVNVDMGENELMTVSVQGNIQGINSNSSFFENSGYNTNEYNNALNYFHDHGSGQKFANHPYYWAKHGLIGGNEANQSAWLHPNPLSFSVARDPLAGAIGYSYSYDTRPPHLITNSVSESISVSDTYPGEIFSATPVIGRSQPVLQYFGSRSEYKRSLTINITMGNTGSYNSELWQYDHATPNSQGVIPQGDIQSHLRNTLINEKPSINNSTELTQIFNAVNPVNDPNFTVRTGKCFHNAPTENWDARTRNYTYSIEWTYEKVE